MSFSVCFRKKPSWPNARDLHRPWEATESLFRDELGKLLPILPADQPWLQRRPRPGLGGETWWDDYVISSSKLSLAYDHMQIYSHTRHIHFFFFCIWHLSRKEQQEIKSEIWLQSYPQRAGMVAGCHSNQAGTTADSSCLISSAWSSINYQVCLLFGWYECHQPALCRWVWRPLVYMDPKLGSV